MKNFLKGIVVGIGGMAPGLSGSVLLVVFGLYRQTVDAIGHIFKNFKKNLLFLVPLALGMGIGLVGSSKLIELALSSFEMQTRFLFLGLVLGTLPLLLKEVKKEGFSKKYYVHMAVAAVLGLLLFSLNTQSFPQLQEPNSFQCVLVGIAVAGSYILPCVDSAVILSTLGFYSVWLTAVGNFDISLLIPIGIGGVIGVLVFSLAITALLKRFYTATFSIIFGLFISIIPNVLRSEAPMPFGFNGATAVSLILCLAGLAFSFFFSDLQENLKRVRRLVSGKRADKSEAPDEENG
ncbi:MAG: DUF368 domain-containing protein [Ruminococcaceae bacterium]|nr:DUF368 domain-containing protein [Oscillospiraceae bacterium]